MARGPKKAPINAHKKVFAPLLSATNQSKTALDMNIVETNMIPIIKLLLTICSAAPNVSDLA